MNSHRHLRSPACLMLILWFGSACVVERIDQIIDDHGVTSGSSGGSEDGQETGVGSSSTTEPAPDSQSTFEPGTSGPGEGDSSTSGDLTDTTGEAADSGGTTASAPSCGDGILQAGEACDDGNLTPDDGCQQCAKDSVIFISSAVYQGFALEGLYGADQRCRSLAAKAFLARSETFRAWLSTPSETVADRLIHSPGRYILVNGLVVAQNWDSLTSGDLTYPIVVDELSQTQDTRAWTGTLADGRAALGSEFCGDWDDKSGFIIYGGEGRSVVTDPSWSFFEQGECGSLNHIYCVEQ